MVGLPGAGFVTGAMLGGSGCPLREGVVKGVEDDVDGTAKIAVGGGGI